MNEESRVVIREARRGDIPALTQLAGELGYVSEEKQMGQRFAHVTADTGNQVFVAENSVGTVVGWVQVHRSRSLAVDPRGEVMGLIVTDAARERGVGRQLMQAAETWTKQQGCALLALRSNIVRKEAHVFYERLGYAVTKTSLYFSKKI